MKLITFAQLGPEKGIPRCRDHVRRLVKIGKFPAPIQLSEHKIASSGGRGSIGFSMRSSALAAIIASISASSHQAALKRLPGRPRKASPPAEPSCRGGFLSGRTARRGSGGIAAWHRAVDPETAALPAKIFR